MVPSCHASSAVVTQLSTCCWRALMLCSLPACHAAAQRDGRKLAAGTPGRCCAPLGHGGWAGCDGSGAARGCGDYPPLEPARWACSGGQALQHLAWQGLCGWWERMANCVISHHLLKRWGLQPFHAGLWSLARSTPPLVAVVNGVGTLYSTAWDCALKTVAAEGPMALYKGALPAAVFLAAHRGRHMFSVCSDQRPLPACLPRRVHRPLPACRAPHRAHSAAAGPHAKAARPAAAWTAAAEKAGRRAQGRGSQGHCLMNCFALCFNHAALILTMHLTFMLNDRMYLTDARLHSFPASHCTSHSTLAITCNGIELTAIRVAVSRRSPIYLHGRFRLALQRHTVLPALPAQPVGIQHRPVCRAKVG